MVQRTIGPAYTPDDLYAANLVSALGAIDAGVTNVLDWSHIQNTPEHTDAAIKGLMDSGVRAVFAYGNPANGLPNFWDDPRQKYPDDLVRLRKQYFSSSDQLMTLALASLGGPQDRLPRPGRWRATSSADHHSRRHRHSDQRCLAKDW